MRPCAPAGAGPPAPVVRLAGVTRRFGAVPALDGVSLAVAPGEVLGIIGRSGAGKSTLIRCLNGLERPDAGEVEILGRSLRGLPERELRRMRGRIGMIFQHFNLLSAKTVAENVALPLRIAGVGPARRAERVAELLRLVGLDGKAAATPRSCRAGRSSASASPARSRPSRRCCCPTRRPRRSTPRPRPRSSTCCATSTGSSA